MSGPVRDRVNEFLENTERTPLDKAGGGNLVGAGGFIAAEALKPAFDFIPGLKPPGYKMYSHSAEKIGGVEEHTYAIAAISRQVAEFAAQYASAPSNADYFTSETEIVETELVTEHGGYSTWRITVHVDEFGEIER